MKNSLLIILIWLSASCATRVANTNNFTVVPEEPTTFLIHPTNDHVSLSAKNKQLDEQLQQIITAGLKEKGLRVASEPDLYVSYMINVYLSSDMRNEENYPYTGYNFMYPKYYSVTECKEGVLIIDLRNHVGDLVWQGFKPFKLTGILEVQKKLPNLGRKIIKTYNY